MEELINFIDENSFTLGGAEVYIDSEQLKEFIKYLQQEKVLPFNNE